MIHAFLKTSQFIPNEFHHSFFEIDFQKLYDNGFRLIITDLDNTLISYDELYPTDQILETFATIRTIGFEIVLLSNNHQNRLDTFCENIDIKGFANARKPLKIGVKKAFKSAQNPSKETTVLIGDQLMTDVWCAKRFGTYSILVNPLKKKTEKWYTKINRKIEQKMLEKINKKYPTVYHSLQLSERT